MKNIPCEMLIMFEKNQDELKEAQSNFLVIKQKIVEYCFKNELLHCLELSPRWKNYCEAE